MNNEFLRWLSQRIAANIDKENIRQICKNRMAIGDGKTIFTDADRARFRQFIEENKN